MSKITLTSFALFLLLFFGNGSATYAAQSKQNTSDAPTGTVQKMIVENGSVSMNLDLNRLNGITSASQNLQQAPFAVGANSFFPILVFNDLLRGPEPGSMALIPVEAAVPAAGPSVSQATSASGGPLQQQRFGKHFGHVPRPDILEMTNLMPATCP